MSTRWPRIFLLWLCGVMAAMQFAKVSVAFQDLRMLYAVSSAKMGMVLSTVGMVGMVFGVTVGLFAAAIGYRRLLLWGLALGAVVSLLQSWMLPFPVLWLSRVFEGASHLAVVVAAPTLIAANCGPRHRSVAMGLWSTFMGVAFAVTAALGSVLISHMGIDGFPMLHAVGMAALWVATARLPDRSNATDARTSWPPLKTMVAQHVQIYTRLHTALPGLCFFCYTAMAVALLTFLPQFAGKDGVLLAVLMPLLSICGSLSAGWLAQHWMPPMGLARGAFGGIALAAVGAWLCTWAGISMVPAALLLLFCAGLASGAVYASIPYLAHDSALQARANGAVVQMGNLGSTFGPPLFAALLTSFGFTGVAIPVLAFALLGWALTGWAHRKKVSDQSH